MYKSLYRSPFLSSLILSAFILVASPNFSHAAGLVQCEESNPSSCTLCALFSTIKAIYDKATEWTLILGVLYIIFGGYQILVSGANPALYAKGRKHILNAFIGLAIVIGAWFLVNAFMVALTGGGTLYGAPWQTLQCK